MKRRSIFSFVLIMILSVSIAQERTVTNNFNSDENLKKVITKSNTITELLKQDDLDLFNDVLPIYDEILELEKNINSLLDQALDENWNNVETEYKSFLKEKLNNKTDTFDNIDWIEYDEVKHKPQFIGCEELKDEELDQCNLKKIQYKLLIKLMYPERAIEQDRQGTSYISFFISKTGKIESPRILRSSRHLDLDLATLEAFSKITSQEVIKEPGYDKNNNHVKVRYYVPVKFRLE